MSKLPWWATKEKDDLPDLGLRWGRDANKTWHLLPYIGTDPAMRFNFHTCPHVVGDLYVVAVVGNPDTEESVCVECRGRMTAMIVENL